MADMTQMPQQPPRPTTADGRPRRVGVEVEFAGIDVPRAVTLLMPLLGGNACEIDPHHYEIRDTPYGTFEVELDVRFAHKARGRQRRGDLDLVDRIETHGRALFGDLVRPLVPVEVVTPPMPIEALGEVDRMIERLRMAGALGTTESPAYGFGLHLNPEVASTETADILAHLRAYLLLSPWLRREIDLDFTRRVLPFTDPFPGDYTVHVLQADYVPTQAQLIDDYVAFNPTRNRELDMLPLFAHLDAERVMSAVEDELIKPRPTFHYRLPDCRIADETWSVVGEWNRWLAVESLAARPESLADLAAARLVETPPSAYDRVVGWLDRVLGSE